MSIETSPDEAKARTARYLLGGVFGAVVAGDGSGLLGRGQMSILNLGHGDPVPPLHHMNAVVRCFASEVPPELSSSRGWPKVLDHRQVAFYPRTLMGKVTLRWTSALCATLPGVGPDFTTRVDLLQVWKARAALRRWGYPLP